MKKAFKYSALLGGGLVVAALLGGTYVKTALPDIDVPPNIKAAVTPESVERGRYLANHVAVCMDCHSTRDWSRFSGPPLKGKEPGGGGERFGKEAGFPGDFYAANITPYALKDWTDGEIFRAITAGVSKDGRPLFPVMPYHNYGQLDKEDILDIIAYLRSLKPVPNKVPSSKADFPFNFIIHTIPKEPVLSHRPFKEEVLPYGKYLVNMAGCVDCHSNRNKGAIVPGSEFGGGMEFRQPAGVVRAPNISPDVATGIGTWSRETFIRTFRQYADSSYKPVLLSKDDLNSPMPWTMYGHMSADDLSAIYTYLASIKPVKNEVKGYEKH